MHHMSGSFRGIESDSESAVGDRLSQKHKFENPAVFGPFVSSWIIIQTMTTEPMKACIVSQFSVTNSTAANCFWL